MEGPLFEQQLDSYDPLRNTFMTKEKKMKHLVRTAYDFSCVAETYFWRNNAF